MVIKLKKIKFVLMMLLLFIAFGVGGWIWISLNYVYSTGERAGYIQKFSRKGWIFKTWEGELALVNLPGAMPEKFLFSARDPVVASQIEKTMGNRVVLKYNEHRFIPTNIFGETPYFAVGVRPVENGSSSEILPAK